ncbi:hypothetical protein OBV_14270 [Oscillibacter valericigenes Sjm18-20]|nr:hypothetical protein OBV_14270 [Oscillibacter valericigenes Sjm18-20]
MKKTIPILAVLLLLSTTTALAAEYPTAVEYSADNGIYEIRKTYELPAGQEPSEEVKQDFQQDGYSYTLTDLLRQELPEKQSRDYSETFTVDSKSKELANVLPLLANTKTATTEDGFTGTLTLDASTVAVEPAGYKSNSCTVTATRTYPNLSDMDMQYIPKTTTENGRTLNFSSVDWQTDNTMNVTITLLVTAIPPLSPIPARHPARASPATPSRRSTAAQWRRFRWTRYGMWQYSAERPWSRRNSLWTGGIRRFLRGCWRCALSALRYPNLKRRD